MAETFKVLDTRRILSPDPTRAGKMDWLLTYELDAFHKYTVLIPKEDLSEGDIIEAVRKDIEAVTRWTGKEFKL